MGSNSSPVHLEIWDYVSLGCLIMGSSLVGIYHIFTARKATKSKEFLVTSSGLGLFPLIFSTVATYWSAIGMLAFPMETYMNGLSFSLASLSVLISSPIACHLFLPVFFKLNRNTVFEYLELRFCKSIRICTSVLLTIQTILYSSIVLYVPALALNQVTGLHLWTSVVSIGVICIAYTSLGGMRAVVWADVTQFFIMVSVYILILCKGTIDIGGVGVIWERLKEGHRTNVLNWSPSSYSQYTVWSILIGFTIGNISEILNQGFMQRYLSNTTLKRAQITFYGGTIGVAIGYFVIAMVGSLIYATYHNCDQLLNGKLKTRDQMIALFAVQTLSFCKGLPGVFVAGVMCATLSTLSSMLNSLAAISLSDYIKPMRPHLSDAESIKYSRVLVLVYGVVSIVLVAWAQNMGGVIKACFTAFGLTGGPILAVFTIGMLFPFVNSTGAIWGFLASIILPLWASLGNTFTSPKTPHAPLTTEGCTNFTIDTNTTTPPYDYSQLSYLESFYSMHSFWYTSWSVAVAITVALLVTKFFSSQDLNQLDPDLLFPFVKNYILKKKLLQANNYVHEFSLEATDKMIKSPVVEPLLCNDKVKNKT